MMKKLISLITMMLLLTSCTQGLKKQIGGTITIKVEPGQEVLECTWKDGGSLWILTRPMKADYVPETKTFEEHSDFGIVEAKVILQESR